MGALGDVIDRFNTFPTPVKILVVGGVGVAGYLGYRHVAAGGGTSSSVGGSGGTIPLDLAPQGTTDNLTANGGKSGGSSGGSGSGSGGGGTTSTHGSGGSGGQKPPIRKPPTRKPPTRKPPVHRPPVHTPTVKHLRDTAATTQHPNIGYGTKAIAQTRSDTPVSLNAGGNGAYANSRGTGPVFVTRHGGPTTTASGLR